MSASRNLLVCLGNFNNLAWFTCFNVANSLGLRSILVLRPYRKLRDEPLLEHPKVNIRRTILRDDDELYNLLQTITSGQEENLIFILSGDNIKFATSIRNRYPDSAIIYYPIGFELEAIAFGSACDAYRKFIEFVSAVDYVLWQDQVSVQVKSLMKAAGGDTKALPYSRTVHVLRPTLINRILVERPPSIDVIKTFDSIPKENPTIFWSSRITSELIDIPSMNNKGFRCFIKDLTEYDFGELGISGINLLLINRDSISAAEITRASRLIFQKSKFHVQLSILPELNYSNFCYVLSRSGLSVDTYSPDGSLRVNMTTSDALSVGARIISCFDPTLHSQILRDPTLEASNSTGIFKDLPRFLNKSHADSSQRRAKRISYIKQSLYSYSEFAESAFFCRLLN